jgi:hypothetical protein
LISPQVSEINIKTAQRHSSPCSAVGNWLTKQRYRARVEKFGFERNAPVILWMFMIAVNVALLVITAAAKAGDVRMAYAHMIVAAVICGLFALAAMRDTRRLIGADASRAAIAAKSAQYMTYVWAWGALGLIASYGFGVVSWREWWHFFLAFAVAGAAAMFFVNLLQRDAVAGKTDKAILKISRYLAGFQFFGMLAVVLGLIIDGKMTRFLIPRHGDWAANNIFFFGALALMAISAYALKVSANKDQG